jgi:hypothetical protein
LKKLIILKALRKEGSKTEKAWMEAWGGGGFSVYKKSVENKCTRTKKTFFNKNLYILIIQADVAALPVSRCSMEII